MRLASFSTALAAVLISGALPGTAAAQEGAFQQHCVVADSRLAELSGLASDGETWYAVGDGGSALRVVELDPADCSVRDVRSADVDPYDVEDLALAADGSLWLADTGDNKLRRENVALHVLRPSGEVELFRLENPDGPHDAEALLLDAAGTPFIVTKEYFGAAGVYRPTEALDENRAVPLQRVASLDLPVTNTPGGPIKAGLGTKTVTGGSVSEDGTLIAIRTYTEVYLYHAPDKDVLAALQRRPARIALPGELQGEAIAWQPDGSLLSASEGNQPVRIIPAAADIGRKAAEQQGVPDRQPVQQEKPAAGAPDSSAGSSALPLVVAGAVAALLLVLRRRFRGGNS